MSCHNIGQSYSFRDAANAIAQETGVVITHVLQSTIKTYDGFMKREEVITSHFMTSELEEMGYLSHGTRMVMVFDEPRMWTPNTVETHNRIEL